MVLRLCRVLDVPLRDRNAMLITAGHAPRFPDVVSDSSSMDEIREIAPALLAAHRYPAVVMDSRWNVIASNSAADIFTAGLPGHLLSAPMNLVRLSLHPDGLSSRLVDFPLYAARILARLRRRLIGTGDPFVRGLLDEFAHLEVGLLASEPTVTIPVAIRLGDQEVRLVSAAATFGSPAEGVASSLVLETFYPADAESRQAVDAMSAEVARATRG
jgi:hypothetical protein